MDVRQSWTDCGEAGDYVVPNVLSPRDLVSRPDRMDETVPHTRGTTSDDFNGQFFRKFEIKFFCFVVAMSDPVPDWELMHGLC